MQFRLAGKILRPVLDKGSGILYILNCQTSRSIHFSPCVILISGLIRAVFAVVKAGEVEPAFLYEKNK